MILILFLASILFTSISPVFFHKKDSMLIAVNQTIIMILIAASLAYAFYQPHNPGYTLSILSFNDITLTLSLQSDSLTKIMMIFILLIGFLIYRYAQHYLESDNTRVRFLSQFNLVLFSVLLLVMAANLLTAFVAWQFIGINLYLLLNHYHDPAANRAAKKKFVINRLGDSSFLLAIILAYQSQSANSFAALQSSPHAELICGLLFISVMTKCAQFPFHLWLIDTMETPTPVSALMHAGVINAGGILLARISESLMHFHGLAYLILSAGLISICLSIHWMNQQPDTKKKLAYSTMGQMGYMITQCSLGAFPAAIFHLMSHGFYKASLFLNAGETLNNPPRNTEKRYSHGNLLKSSIISVMILFAGMLAFKGVSTHIPVLMYGFLLATLISLITKANTLIKNPTIILYYLGIFLVLVAYFYCFKQFYQLLHQYEYTSTISTPIQIAILIGLVFLQYFLWTNKVIKPQKIKDRTEEFLRQLALKPLRLTGNIINIARYRNIVSTVYMLVLLAIVISFIYGILHQTPLTTSSHELATFVFLTVGIIALVIANRCLSIKLLITYLILFELAFANIAFFSGNSNIATVGIFHVINISLVLFMLALLSRQSLGHPSIEKHRSRLPTRGFYLIVSLLLLIGIPGTASFISEFYVLNSLIHGNILFILMYISLIILVAIVVMHSLQLYAFNKNHLTLLSEPIKRKDHFIFLTVIIINIISGIYPTILLQHL